MRWAWGQLSAREKQICLMYVVSGKGRKVIASDLGISRSRLTVILTTIFSLMDVDGAMGLAFEMGRHWNKIRPKGKADGQSIK